MLAVLHSGDWYPPEIAYRSEKKSWDQEIGSIKLIGWTRLLDAAGLIKMVGSKSSLTPAGRRFSQQPAWDSLRHLWEKWLTNKDYDEFNRIDDIKGQSSKHALTARTTRRPSILAALEECPEGQWISLAAFSRYMRAEGHHFEISPDPWKLYVCDRQYGSLSYSGFHDWEILQDRFLLCFFMEYAATLGLVDIAYIHPEGALSKGDLWGVDDMDWLSRYDGLRAIRINALGTYCLNPDQQSYQPPAPQAQIQTQLSVRPDLTIHTLAGNPSSSEQIMLDSWAEPIAVGTWRADPARAIVAVEAGRDPSEFSAFLSARDPQPLPEMMESFLKTASQNGNALHHRGEAILSQCRDAATAALICKNKDLARFCLPAGDTAIAVPQPNLTTFRKNIRALGLGIR